MESKGGDNSNYICIEIITCSFNLFNNPNNNPYVYDYYPHLIGQGHQDAKRLSHLPEIKNSER